MENSNGSGYLREEHGTLNLPSNPAPSSLLLQGGKGFSRSSSKFSSLEGVWLPRKCKKTRESEGKRKEAEILKGSRLKKNFINEGEFNSTCLGGFYSQTPFTNYQNNIANTITMGAKKEENQKVTKRSQNVKK